METQKPKIYKDIKETSFKLKDKEQNTSYTLSFSIESNSLIVNITEDNSLPVINYKAKFTLNDLVKQSNYFKLFESLDQLISEIKSLYEQNDIKLRKEKSEIILVLSLPLKIIDEVLLCIPQADIDSKTIVNDLCSTVNELRKKIKSLTANVPEEKLAENLKSKEILLNEEEKKMVCDWILKQMKSEGKKIEMNLLYRLTRDGDSASTFHS